MSNECSFMKRIASCQACLIEVIGASRHLVHSRLAGVNAASACCTCWNVKRLKMVRVNLLWFQIAERVWPDNMHSSGGIKCDLCMWSLWPVAGCVFVVYQMQYNHCLCFSFSLSLIQCGSGARSAESVWRSQPARAGLETGQDTDQWICHPVPCDHGGPGTWLPAWHGKTGGRLKSYIQQLGHHTYSLSHVFFFFFHLLDFFFLTVIWKRLWTSSVCGIVHLNWNIFRLYLADFIIAENNSIQSYSIDLQHKLFQQQKYDKLCWNRFLNLCVCSLVRDSLIKCITLTAY